MHRYRDWPIRVVTFISALFFALMWGILNFEINLTMSVCQKLFLSLLLSGLFIWGLYFIARCHKNYLQSRNVQIKIQKNLKLDEFKVNGNKVFPEKWFKEIPEKVFKRWWGWGFYAFYCIILWSISITLILTNIEVKETERVAHAILLPENLNLLLIRLGLILNIIGALLIAFAFGKNLEDAHQTRKSWITKKEIPVYLASFLHPVFFRIGCVLLILGFTISLWAKR